MSPRLLKYGHLRWLSPRNAFGGEEQHFVRQGTTHIFLFVALSCTLEMPSAMMTNDLKQ